MLGVRSRRLLMVIAQEPIQSLPALNRLRLVGDIRITREQQDVTLALVIPLDMIMFDEFVQRPPQRALAQEDHFGQALLEPSAPQRHSSSDSGQAALEARL